MSLRDTTVGRRLSVAIDEIRQLLADLEAIAQVDANRDPEDREYPNALTISQITAGGRRLNDAVGNLILDGNYTRAAENAAYGLGVAAVLAHIEKEDEG